MLDIIEQAIKPYDRYQVEMKLSTSRLVILTTAGRKNLEVALVEILPRFTRQNDRYDRNRELLKLDYELLDGQDTRYRVSTYIFVPNSLSITPQSYPSSDFYRDVQNYIRLKTSVLSLRDLCDYSSAPLVNIMLCAL